jgi:hypothetical protein
VSCQAYGSAAWSRGIFGPFLGPRRYVSERFGDVIPSYNYHLISCKGWIWQEPEEGRLDLPHEERHQNQDPPSLQVHEHQLDELLAILLCQGLTAP